MTLFLQLVLFPLYGAALYRWRGHASKYKKYLPRPFNQILFAAPYALLCLPPHVEGWLIAPVILALTTLAVLSGHGKWLDLGKWEPQVEDETTEIIIKPLEEILPRYWYDVVGMAWSGLLITIPAGIALANPVIALSGALKGPAYMAGHYIHDDDGEAATALGEWLTGGALYMALAVCVVIGYI